MSKNCLNNRRYLAFLFFDFSGLSGLVAVELVVLIFEVVNIIADCVSSQSRIPMRRLGAARMEVERKEADL